MKTHQEHIPADTISVDSARGPLADPAGAPLTPLWVSPAYGEDLTGVSGSGPFRPAESAFEVFGPDSRLEAVAEISGGPVRFPENQRVNELLLDGLVVLLFFFYTAHLFRYRTSITLLLRSLATPGQFDALVGEQSVTFRSFIRNSRLMGFLALLVIALKWSIRWDESPAPVSLPDELTVFLLPVLLAALIAVLFYKRIVTGIIAVLSGKGERVGSIRMFNRIWFSVSSLFLAPVALLCGLADPAGPGWLYGLDVIVLIICVLYYIGKSFSFFVSRKISILQWILYLCAVEIWPVSFFVLFAVRGFEW